MPGCRSPRSPLGHRPPAPMETLLPPPGRGARRPQAGFPGFGVLLRPLPRGQGTRNARPELMAAPAPRAGAAGPLEKELDRPAVRGPGHTQGAEGAGQAAWGCPRGRSHAAGGVPRGRGPGRVFWARAWEALPARPWPVTLGFALGACGLAEGPRGPPVSSARGAAARGGVAPGRGPLGAGLGRAEGRAAPAGDRVPQGRLRAGASQRPSGAARGGGGLSLEPVPAAASLSAVRARAQSPSGAGTRRRAAGTGGPQTGGCHPHGPHRPARCALKRDLRRIYGSESPDPVRAGTAGAPEPQLGRAGAGPRGWDHRPPAHACALSLRPAGLSARGLHQSEAEAALETSGGL